MGRPVTSASQVATSRKCPPIDLGLIGSTIQVRIASGSGLLVISPYPQEVMAAYTVHVGPTGGTYDIFANGQQVQSTAHIFLISVLFAGK